MTDHRADTTINGRRYGLVKPSPTTALKFAPRIAKLIGGALSGTNLDSIGDFGKGNEQAALQALAGAIAKLDSAETTALLEDTFAHFDIFNPDGDKLASKAVFDSHFRQHPGDMLQVALWALWAGCGDFFFDKESSSLTDLAGQAGSLFPKDGKPNTDSEG